MINLELSPIIFFFFCYLSVDRNKSVQKKSYPRSIRESSKNYEYLIRTTYVPLPTYKILPSVKEATEEKKKKNALLMSLNGL